ncbi:hypothetical protein BH20CHL6_BH20CHL6_01560 [soil metagenome]
MTDLPVPVAGTPLYRPLHVARLGPDAPGIDELCSFMRDAELRFDRLRLRILDRTHTALGERTETVELWLRHPGAAKVISRRGTGQLSQDFDIWISDGDLVRTYHAGDNVASVRPMRQRLAGVDSPDLPAFAKVYAPRTSLPRESIVDAFVHPNGYARNVLSTGPVTLVGATELVGDREAFLLRVDHPRISHVLTDRPDRWIEVAVDRTTGLMLLLIEHIGDRVSRHAEVVDLEVDGPIPAETFTLHLPDDVKMIY